MKIYIDDFVEDLNYRKVILSIFDIDLNTLYARLKKDNVSHINRFASVIYNHLMFIENCDLQDVDTDNIYENGNSLFYLIEAGYVIYPLRYDEFTERYFVETELS